jgi:hypothetical protein
MAEHSSTTILGGHTDAIAAGASGFMSGSDKAKLDGIAAGANVTGANPPQAHSASHVGGSDAIAVATGATNGLMSSADKAKLDGLSPSGPGMCFGWGATAAIGTAAARYFIRSSGTPNAALSPAAYPSPVAGSRTVYLTWNIAGTPLATDSVTLTLVVNGVATALVTTVAPGQLSGQASATLTLAVGDSLAVRGLQSAAEAQSLWGFSVSISS